MDELVNITVQLDPIFKAEVEELFEGLGLSMDEAIHLFLEESLLEGKLPFEVPDPRFNRKTREAMAEGIAIAEGRIPAKRYSSVQEMMRDVLAEEGEDDDSMSPDEINAKLEQGYEDMKAGRVQNASAAFKKFREDHAE